MHKNNISIKNSILPRNIDILNEQILFQDKLQIEDKNLKINFQNNKTNSKKYLIQKKEFQENSINEEDSYKSDVYNNSIVIDEIFLNEFHYKSKFKTIQMSNYFNGINKILLKFNNFNKLNSSDYYQKFYSTSIEFKSNLKLNHIEENEQSFDENLYFLNKNINIFKIVNKKRKGSKILSQNLNRKISSKSNLSRLKFNNNIAKRFSRKCNRNNKEFDNGMITNHSKMITQSFNGPYLRKNKVSQINRIKSVNKNNSIKNSKFLININDDRMHSQRKDKIKAINKGIFKKYSQIDTNIYDQKVKVSKEKHDVVDEKINKNTKNVENTLYDDKKKKDFLAKSSNNISKKSKNYFLNLKYNSLYNNKFNNRLKLNSNSLISEYSNFDENYFNSEKSAIKPKERLPKNTIIKKRVIFEEEYAIDSNRNQKFLCVKRLADDNSKSEPNKNNKMNIKTNKRTFTSNNLIFSSKGIKTDYNIKDNNKIINKEMMDKDNQKLEARTVFCSPQISFENIFSPSLFLTKKSSSRITEINNYMPKSLISNINKVKDKNEFLTSKREFIKNGFNNKFHQIVNNNNKNKNKFANHNSKNRNIEKKKIIYDKISNDKPIIPKNNSKKKNDGTKVMAINNSRNYNYNNYIDLSELNNKEKIELNKKINNNINNRNYYIYNTTNFENNVILLPSNFLFQNKSERSNFKYHEIKSVSREKKKDNQSYFTNNSQNSYIIFEPKNNFPQIIPCTSMDNIKMKKNSNLDNDKSEKK